MPTPESAEVFYRLVAARTRLSEASKALNDCHANLASLPLQSARERYHQLQDEWKEAFQAYEKATDEFSATVKRLHQDVEEHRLPKLD